MSIINEPGRTYWEDFRTATRAAAAGGYTTLVEMPLNSLPATTTVEDLRAKESATWAVQQPVAYTRGSVPVERYRTAAVRESVP